MPAPGDIDLHDRYSEESPMNHKFRKPLNGTTLDYFDTEAAIEAIKPGAYAGLPYTSKVLAENLVRRCAPEDLNDALGQIIERKRDIDFPWFPARVVCHDILGQTALVDLAGLRDAIAAKGGDLQKSIRWYRLSSLSTIH